MATYRLIEKTPLTDRISAFAFAPTQGNVPLWEAGAHIDIELTGLGSRSYSLIHWPGDGKDTLVIAVQAEPDGSGGSQAVHQLEVGAEVSLSDPKNSFSLQASAKPFALIAGGIGVTPLISMATEMADTGREFVFHYSGRTQSVMAYRDALLAAFPKQMHFHFDDKNPADLTALAITLRDHAVYICGPKGLIDAMRTAAEAAGVPAGDIHVELFSAPDADTGDSAFEVELASTNEVVGVEAGQTIIEALEAAGHDVMYDCQRGDCGICQVDVLAGEPDHRDVVLSDAEKASGKVMQICVSRAKSARLVLDI